jgi:hypothetical protein
MLKPLTECGIYIASWNRHTNELQNNKETHLPEKNRSPVSNNHAVFAILSSLQPIPSLEPSVQPLHVLPLDYGVARNIINFFVVRICET